MEECSEFQPHFPAASIDLTLKLEKLGDDSAIIIQLIQHDIAISICNMLHILIIL